MQPTYLFLMLAPPICSCCLLHLWFFVFPAAPLPSLLPASHTPACAAASRHTVHCHATARNLNAQPCVLHTTLCASLNLVCFRYVASAAGLNQSDPLYEHWKGVFDHFLPKEEEQQLEGDDDDRLIKSRSKHVTCHTCWSHVTTR